MVGPRIASVEWQARQLSSRWQETHVRMLRWAASEWLLGRGLEITAPPASRTQPGGWNVLRPVPVPKGLFGRRPGSPPSGSDATPRRRWPQPMARRTVGHVAAGVDHVNGDVVGRVDIGRPHDAAVTVDAVVALVAGEAVLLVAPGRRVGSPGRRAPGGGS